MGLSYERKLVGIFYRLSMSTMHECDRQTNGTDHGIVTCVQ